MTSDPFDLGGRVALVTGASRGIGRAIALRLAAHGATVAVTSRKVEACEEVVGKCLDLRRCGRRIGPTETAMVISKNHEPFGQPLRCVDAGLGQSSE